MNIRNTLIILLLLVIGGTMLWYGLSMSPGDDMTDTNPPQNDAEDKVSWEEGDTEAASTLIKVEAPQTNATVGNPVTIKGQARGQWFFEGSAPVVVVDWDGRIIGEGYVTAEGEWMSEDFVAFSGSVVYNLPSDSYSASGAIILKRANPSGLPENDDAYEVPVNLTVEEVAGETPRSLPVSATACTPEQKQAEFCTEEYAPVCGVVETQCAADNSCQIERRTFSNGCFACAAEGVVAYREGECAE